MGNEPGKGWKFRGNFRSLPFCLGAILFEKLRDLKGFLFGVIGQHFGIHLLSIVLVKKSTRMFQQTFHSGL